MTREGLVEHNTVTGEEVQLSQRDQDFNLRSGDGKEKQTAKSRQGASARREQSPEAHDQAVQGSTTGAEDGAVLPNDGNADDSRRGDAPTHRGAPKAKPPPKKQGGTAYYRRFAADEPKSKDAATASDAGTEKKSKLEFAKDEQTPDSASGASAPDQKLEKSKKKAGKSADKLEQAKKKLPTQRKVRLGKEVNEETGKLKRKLYFEQEVKPQHEHLKGPLPLRPVKLGANEIIRRGHEKIHEVEHENVGVKAAHRGELLVEDGLRHTYRFHKTRPYRRVRKLQKKATKQARRASYRQALHDNPRLRSNVFSRMMQKRKIKQQYAKAARDTKRAAGAAKKTATITSRVVRRIIGAVARHPAVFGAIVVALLLLIPIFGFISSFSNIATGGISSVLASSYLATDVDIDDAGLIYTEWETDLRVAIADIEQTHPGFDEYRFNIGEINHNPFELMAFLTAVFQDFTFSEVESVLREIFAEQYQLSIVPEVEIRTRQELGADGEIVTVEYEWHILHVTLATRSFTNIILSRMDMDQRQIFELLMMTKGNRQYLDNVFNFNWLPFVSSRYGYRIHPIDGVKAFHFGIDIAVPTGTEILAGHDGLVTVAGDSGGYGLMVVLNDGNGLVSRYAHCSVIFVAVGQRVERGDVIAEVGSTGASTGPHLHLEIIKNGRHLNPMFFAVTGDDGSGRIPPGWPGGPLFPSNPGEPMSDEAFAALYAEARRRLGTPYVYGANGPHAFDCSSFICWIFTHSGVRNLPRTTAQGIFNQTTPIHPNQARRGDLIFFTRTYSTTDIVTHVGLYVGNGQMIHAGRPVQYASIHTPFWQDHFWAFGRF